MPATKTKPAERARFLADGIGLRITIDHPKEEWVNNGNSKIVTDPGLFAEFKPNGHGGQEYETSDPRIIEILREKAAGADPKFAEVPIPKPSSAPVLAQITKLAVRGDTDALVALAKEETDTWGREDVLDSIADALEQIGS